MCKMTRPRPNKTCHTNMRLQHAGVAAMVAVAFGAYGAMVRVSFVRQLPLARSGADGRPLQSPKRFFLTALRSLLRPLALCSFYQTTRCVVRGFGGESWPGLHAGSERRFGPRFAAWKGSWIGLEGVGVNGWVSACRGLVIGCGRQRVDHLFSAGASFPAPTHQHDTVVMKITSPHPHHLQYPSGASRWSKARRAVMMAYSVLSPPSLPLDDEAA
jgi:hypothetical protein